MIARLVTSFWFRAFLSVTGRIAELLSRMDEREPRMADTEDRLRRTMETILDRIGDPDGVPDQELPRDHHRQAEAPEHQRGGDTRRRH